MRTVGGLWKKDLERWRLSRSIVPEESASRGGKRRSKTHAKTRSMATTPRPNKNTTPEGPDLAGSDLDPPKSVMQRSVRMVEAWLEDCERAVASENSGSGSMVSLLGVGLVDRPGLDVAVYGPLTEQGGAASTKLSRKSILKSTSRPSRSEYTFNPRKVRDCVYDEPSRALENELLEGLSAGNERPILGKLQRLMKRKKKVKGENEVPRRHHPDQGQYEACELFMSGGWSPGGTDEMEDGRKSESSGRSVTSARYVSRCLCRGKGDLPLTPSKRSKDSLCTACQSGGSASRELLHGSLYSNDGELSSSIQGFIGRRLSADDTGPKLGFPPNSQKYNNPPYGSASTSKMSSPSRSRASSFNIGSIIELSMSPRALEERERQESEIDRPPSPYPFVPSPPRPIPEFRSSIPLRRKTSVEDFKPIAQRNLSQPTREPGAFVREQMAMPGYIGQGIRDIAAKRERRRADRFSGGTGTESARPFSQTPPVEETTPGFDRNRERRRAERYSAGRIEEVREVVGQHAGRMVSKTQLQDLRQKPGFDVEDEPVASGAAWERRIKKGQSPAKRSTSDKYREGERAKYWSPK